MTLNIMCFMFLNWDELIHAVGGGWKDCGVHFVSMWQNKNTLGFLNIIWVEIMLARS